MAEKKAWIEIFSEKVLKSTYFLWLPFVAFNLIIKKIRKK